MGEILIIIIVAFFALKKSDIKKLIGYYKNFLEYKQNLAYILEKELHKHIDKHEIQEIENDIKEINSEIDEVYMILNEEKENFIRGDDGKYYRTFK